MTSKITIFITLLLVLNSAQLMAEEATYPVQSIEDGDTLLVEINGHSERIQLLGIDAPENTENPKFKLDVEQTGLAKMLLLDLGNLAAEYLQTLVSEGEQITLQGDLSIKDRYGRIPAKAINNDGRELGEAMVQDGYAIALARDQFPEEQDYMHRLDRLERFSRKSANGLWGSHRETVRAWYDRTR